jgi:sulfur relay (sulfurtransferase) complex TusBCD TusD component (DsrE family)
MCWKEFKIPAEWSKAVVKPIFKKGYCSYCSNYRGIRLLVSRYNIYSNIVIMRFQTVSVKAQMVSYEAVHV